MSPSPIGAFQLSRPTVLSRHFLVQWSIQILVQ
jgi:hypothetical protein